MNVGFVPDRDQQDGKSGLSREDALTLYLCRLMRIRDSMAPDGGPARHSAVDLENLLLGAAYVAHLKIDLCRLDNPGHGGTESVLRHALHVGVVQAYPAGTEPPAESASARVPAYALTMLGKHAVDGDNCPPPFRWSPEEAVGAEVPEDDDTAEPGDDSGPAMPGKVSKRRQRQMVRVGIEPDLHDRRKIRWFGKSLYLGAEHTQIAQLFWVLAERLGHACPWQEIRNTVFSQSTNEEPREPEQIRQHVRQVVSKLRDRLKDAKLDYHVVIICENPKEFPSYTMHLRS